MGFRGFLWISLTAMLPVFGAAQSAETPEPPPDDPDCGQLVVQCMGYILDCTPRSWRLGTTRVSVMSADSLFVRVLSDSRGKATFPCMPPGPYELIVEDFDHTGFHGWPNPRRDTVLVMARITVTTKAWVIEHGSTIRGIYR